MKHELALKRDAAMLKERIEIKAWPLREVRLLPHLPSPIPHPVRHQCFAAKARLPSACRSIG
jgi:hypothetical protein